MTSRGSRTRYTAAVGFTCLRIRALVGLNAVAEYCLANCKSAQKCDTQGIKTSSLFHRQSHCNVHSALICISEAARKAHDIHMSGEQENMLLAIDINSVRIALGVGAMTRHKLNPL